MTARATLRRFLRAPARRKRLAVEVALELLRARVLTVLPPKVFLRALGQPVSNESSDAPSASVAEDQLRRAAEIAGLTGTVAAALPFRARCLEQAIALRRVLARRGIAVTVRLGVNLSREARAQPALGEAAHAWVSVGPAVIAGGADVERFAPVACFR